MRSQCPLPAQSLVSLVALVISAFTAADGLAQSGDSTAVVVPGPRYGMSGIGRFFWGDHYRDAWTTPIEVELLNLRSFAGGLTPTRRGGGQQTKSLRFDGNDGRSYAFRSLDKDPAAALPPVLRSSLAHDVLQDQISSQHPVGALICSPLQQAAGVLHAEPRLVLMPDDPALGEFREEFAGMIGMIEERPDENDDSLAAFAGAERVISSGELLDKVRENPAEKVNATALLNARLLDFLVGDWDRHFDQWRWARFSDDSASGWYPIPRDRDQAFSRLDGLFPTLAQWTIPQFVGFSEDFASVFSLHWNARDLDRRFLIQLPSHVWDSVANELVSRLTDDVIEDAVRRLPRELYDVDGAMLEAALKKRREGLPEAAMRFYRLLAEQVDIYGTDVSEDLLIEESPNGQVTVTLAERGRGADPYFTRRFDPGDTKEIRIRLFHGDDSVTVKGSDRLDMTVRIEGGRGDEVYRFETPTSGVRIYDARGTNRLVGEAPPGFRIDRRRYEEDRKSAVRDWGRWLIPTGNLWYSTDYGLLVGAGTTLYTYGFRRDPYRSKSDLYAAVSTDGRYDLSIRHDHRAENSPLHAILSLYATSFDVVHYYGLGNEADTLGSSDYHSVQRGLFAFEPLFAVSATRVFDLAIGPTLRYSKTRSNEGRYIATIPDLYGSGGFGQLGFVIDTRLDTRRGRTLERVEHLDDLTGFTLDVSGSYFPRVWDVDGSYASVAALATASVPTGILPHTVLALRGGGKKIWGEYPWFDAAYLGGLASLRGWRAQRFAGDGSLYGGAELRTYLTDFNIIMPQLFGLFGSVDAGRVWVDGESEGGWHVGYGGGFWLGFLGSRYLFSASYFQADASSGFYVDWGFAF